jgi:glycosyltransferase involved in cell wall biosynthesis
MTMLFFGTYDRRRHPRVTVLMEGCRRLGDEVIECNVPLRDSTHSRVAMLFRPWRAATFAVRVALAWRRLIRRSRATPKPDAIIVGYLGHFDVHLARRLWPETPILLDHLISLADTAADRRSSSRIVHRVLQRVDRAAMRAADVVIVDTEEHRDLLPGDLGRPVVVVEVGAPSQWFARPTATAHARLRVVFFGLFTPLQGVETIARAIGMLTDAPIDFLMVGTGQDYDAARRLAAGNAHVTWLEWVGGDELPAIVASHDVCLGIFGTGAKALRVVPNKVFQGAAAGCAVVTSETPPQRRALGDAGIFVPPGSAESLADTLTTLQRAPQTVWRARQACFDRARVRFTPEAVTAPLYDVQTAHRSRLSAGLPVRR